MRSGNWLALPSIIFFSCTNSAGHKDEVLNLAMETTQQSVRLIENNTEQVFHVLRQKLDEPITSYKAELWVGKADVV
jgi:flavin reductase (DIM6/NTAB) family NADH-FMN oxidoreductase RutF